MSCVILPIPLCFLTLALILARNLLKTGTLLRVVDTLLLVWVLVLLVEVLTFYYSMTW